MILANPAASDDGAKDARFGGGCYFTLALC